MKQLDIAVLDDSPESKLDLLQKHILPGYHLSHTKFAIPANIQGQINAIHQALTILHENLKGDNQKLAYTAGAFLEGLEQDLKNYRIEAQELNL